MNFVCTERAITLGHSIHKVPELEQSVQVQIYGSVLDSCIESSSELPAVVMRWTLLVAFNYRLCRLTRVSTK